MLRSVWSEGDPLAVGLWKELVYHGFYEGAMGLLRDVIARGAFDKIDSVLDKKHSRPPTPAEDAMAMLCDQDGSELRRWMWRLKDDEEFFRHALEMVESERRKLLMQFGKPNDQA